MRPKTMHKSHKIFSILLRLLGVAGLLALAGWLVLRVADDPLFFTKKYERLFWRSHLPPAKGHPVLVLVLDDAGHDLDDLRSFLKLPFPFTVAVIPTAPVARASAQLIRQAGKDAFLHQPMQSQGPTPREPHTLLETMSADEIRHLVSANLDTVGPVKGMNNHQGSAFTQNAEKMEIILRLCRERGLLFLDSCTTPQPVSVSLGTRLDLPVWRNDLFLDHKLTFRALLYRLADALHWANKQGYVVMIGHITHRKDLYPFLKEVYPVLRKKGYRFVLLDQIPPANADELPDEKQK